MGVELLRYVLGTTAMSPSPINPQEIFRSPLAAGTTLIVVFVPSKDRNGDGIDQDHWVDEILTTLGQLFRGATAYPRGKGIWRDDARGGILLREEPVIVFSYVAEEVFTKEALTQLYRTLSRMGREANQGEIGVVIDGKYYGIIEYAEE